MGFRINFVALLFFYAFFISGGAWADACSGFGVCPSDLGLGSNILCKEVVDSNCQSNGCTKYKLCDINSTGATVVTYAVSPASGCHLENGTCQLNTRSCNAFSHRIEPDCWNLGNSLSCEMATNADAVWNGTGWNVSQCSCRGEHNVSALKCNAHYVLRPLNMVISSVDTKITYSSCVSNGGVEQYYCSSCPAGTCPNEIVYNYDGGRCWSGGGDSYYSVCSCSDVQADHYSIGFEVPSSFGGNVSACVVPCGTGLTTLGATGATSSAQCVPDGTVEYQDSTGIFTLGNTLCE